MNDNNIPTPAATTPAPVTIVAKTPKSKGLSIYNRVAPTLLLVLVIAMATLLTFAVQKAKAQKDVQDEIQTLTKQKDALVAPAWCVQIASDNTDKVNELYSTYDRMSSAAQEAVKKGCKDRVNAIRLLKFNDAEDAFTTDSTCKLDDAQTTLHCSVGVSLASNAMKTRLEAFQAIDLALEIWSGESQFVLGTPDHVVDGVATATMTKSERVSVDFTLPFDMSWGSHYKVEVAKYFPNM